MRTEEMKFCPSCSTPLDRMNVNGEMRLACGVPACQFVYWGNPTPVVAIIVEKEGRVVMAHNVAWPHHFYSVITGFLEAGEEPQDCAIRETKEELGLDVSECSLVGCYGFSQQNQVIMAYHVVAHGDVVLNEELDDYRLMAKEELKVWPIGTGPALKEWLESQGYAPDVIPL